MRSAVKPFHAFMTLSAKKFELTEILLIRSFLYRPHSVFLVSVINYGLHIEVSLFLDKSTNVCGIIARVCQR